MAQPIQVANWFIKNLTDVEAGEVVTHLKVQKLLYFAQAWHMLGLDRPLFDEELQAWPHGPVEPSVWRAFRDHRWNPIPAPEGDVDEGLEADTLGILQQVRDIYGAYSAKKLEEMSHAERPWQMARAGLAPEAPCDRIIPKADIVDYYTEIYGAMEDGEEAA